MSGDLRWHGFSKARRTASVSVSIGVVVQFMRGRLLRMQMVPFGPKSTLTQR
jgi:hypothetical protein